MAEFITFKKLSSCGNNVLTRRIKKDQATKLNISKIFGLVSNYFK